MEIKVELEEHIEQRNFHSSTLKEDNQLNTGFVVKMIFMQCTCPMPHVPIRK